ncbi:MAG: peptidylprolyl isomerase [Acidobacteria bacterium]|nr:MAG: peptidylprolyl isomerase [Acidobacteriota bacterium]
MGCNTGGEKKKVAEAPSPVKEKVVPEKEETAKESYEGVKLYATIETNMGTFEFELFPDKAPKTVANFVELAEGKKWWTHPLTRRRQKKRFYDGLTFHRVINGFIIQGGDPLGNGRGGPGYKFEDEIVPDLKFDRPGRVAMANSGPNTNGSQFFITLRALPKLNGKYTIFGQVVKGMNVVRRIARVPTDPRTDRPLKPVIMRKVTIKRVPIDQSKPSAQKEGGRR